MTNQVLDCKNLSCPMPIVKLSSAIKKLNSGDTLSIEATDAAFRADLEAWARKTGHEVMDLQEGPTVTAVIRKK